MSLSKIPFGAKLAEFVAPGRNADASQSPLILGDCVLSENLTFLGEFFDFVAQSESSLMSLEGYLATYREKPLEPTNLDPEILEDAAKFLKGREISDKISAQKALKTVALTLQQKRYGEAKTLHETMRAKFPESQEGYARYILSILPEIVASFFTEAQSLPLCESSRMRHTLLTSGTGGGKSETLKVMVHHYLKDNRDTAVIVIDPHADLADQIARFQENGKDDRLVLIDLTLEEGMTPVMNPFDVGALSSQDREIVLEQILEGMGTILSEGAQFTDQMKSLLSPCLETLIKLPDTSLEHLKQFLDGGRNADLLTVASRLLTSPGDLDFLKRDFDSQSYAPTKQGIRNRLHGLLTKPRFRNFVVGKSTFNLEQAIAEKKLIVFKLSKLTGEDPVAVALGRLIVTSILGVVMKRGKLPEDERRQSVPVHLFIDEAHNYAHPSLRTVLAESRKYRLHLTLATQFLSQFPSGRLRSNIESNTAIKIAGLQARGTTSAKENAKLMGVTSESITRLEVGEFYVQAERTPAYRVKVKSNLADNGHAITPQEWEKVKTSQLQRYYRPVQTPKEAAKSYTYQSDGVSSSPGKPRKKLN